MDNSYQQSFSLSSIMTLFPPLVKIIYKEKHIIAHIFTLGIQAILQAGIEHTLGDSLLFSEREVPSKVHPSICKPPIYNHESEKSKIYENEEKSHEHIILLPNMLRK